MIGDGDGMGQEGSEDGSRDEVKRERKKGAVFIFVFRMGHSSTVVKKLIVTLQFGPIFIGFWPLINKENYCRLG